jgi:N-methylhydantoinase B
MIESDYPIRIERYGFAPDTGGAGKYRGGLGVVREYRILADDIYFGVRSDKALHPPHGLFGGQTGAPAVNLIHSDAGDRVLPPMPMKPITLNTGDVYRHVMAGGGGFGDPFDREPERVRTDVLDGKVTIDHARDAYGVVLGNDALCTVDASATNSLRATRLRTSAAAASLGAAGATVSAGALDGEDATAAAGALDVDGHTAVASATVTAPRR